MPGQPPIDVDEDDDEPAADGQLRRCGWAGFVDHAMERAYLRRRGGVKGKGTGKARLAAGSLVGLLLAAAALLPYAWLPGGPSGVAALARGGAAVLAGWIVATVLLLAAGRPSYPE